MLNKRHCFVSHRAGDHQATKNIKHRGRERARKHQESLAPSTPLPSLLPASDDSVSASLPPVAAPSQPVPLPPTNCSLEFAPPNFADQEGYPAAEPAQVPSPPPSYDGSSVSASPSPPDSPKIHCSQYRQAQHHEETQMGRDGRRAGRQQVAT